MSLQSILSIARSALLAQQRAMEVASHNVANAQTEGYSRQRLQLAAAMPLWSPIGMVGRGVEDLGVSRVRDAFLDAAFRRDSALLGGSSTLSSYLGQVEAALYEPSADGVAGVLDGLFKSFADLANDPSSSANRNLVRLAAGRFVQQVRALDGQIAGAAQDAVDRLRSQVDQVNSLAERIASLNAQIIALGGPQQQAPDLQDQRDLLVDQLSSLVEVKVIQRDNGSIGVVAGDTLLLDGGQVNALSLSPRMGGWVVGPASGGTSDLGSGSVKALLDLVNTTLPAIRAQLDTFVRSVVTEVNAVHRTGTTPGGATGTDFFDPAGLTGATIALAGPVAVSGEAIAAAATPPAGSGAPGDGTVALLIAGLATTGIAGLGGKTLREFYTEFASGVGVQVQDARQNLNVHQVLVDNADAQRSSVSGVSVDEEMVALIAQQQAYGAAARLLKIADEMMQQLLNSL
jgi:flagellar hook-associated protein 1 FlgK